MTATAVLRDSRFELVSDYVKPDGKHRITLGAELTSASADASAYNVYKNAAGQIILDPVAVIPAAELWLFKNPKALAAVREGIEQAGRGETHNLGSFAKYAGEQD